MSKYERPSIVATPVFPDSRAFTSEVLTSFGPAPVDPHAARTNLAAVAGGVLLGRALSRRGRRA